MLVPTVRTADTQPHLFVYYTADGYNKTGCYNHDCTAFVQYSTTVTPGNNLAPVSHTSSAQYEIQLQAKLTGGNWWIFYAGKPMGYYPTSLYHGGQLTKHATLVDYGTETTGTTFWPPAGGGAWSSAGWEKAAYVRELYYISSSTATSGTWETLTRQQPNPNCYSVTGPYYSSTAGWGVYFYDGGPGGGNC